MPGSPEHPRNRLLAALPADTLDRWAPRLVEVDLRLGQVLCDQGAAPDFAYFPTTAIVSLLHVLRDGATAEIAIVGREGMVSAAPLTGGPASNQSVVRAAGRAVRLPAAELVSEFERAGAAMCLFLRYTQALIAQITQMAACNRHHSIDQQLCRWLLLSLDRAEGRELAMTHETISNLLGVRREGVTKAAARLQRAGIIRYARGHIIALDRPALERCSCECYQAVRSEYARLLPEPASACS
jgi:CRP-like cAMP-binding protein